MCDFFCPICGESIEIYNYFSNSYNFSPLFDQKKYIKIDNQIVCFSCLYEFLETDEVIEKYADLFVENYKDDFEKFRNKNNEETLEKFEYCKQNFKTEFILFILFIKK